jgi:hypothetical protein
MATKKKEYVNWTTPKGVAKYVHLNIPQTNFKAAGEYGVHMIYNPEDAAFQTFKAFIDVEMAKGFAEAKSNNPDAVNKTKLFVADTSKDSDGNKIPTGNVAVKFKMTASGKYKDGTVWTRKPSIVDSNGTHVPKGLVIFGGSVIKISYNIKHTLMPTGDFYTSLPLQGAQILTLVDSSVRSAKELGFGKEEGYAVDEDAFGEQTTGPGASASEEVPVVVGDF